MNARFIYSIPQRLDTRQFELIFSAENLYTLEQVRRVILSQPRADLSDATAGFWFMLPVPVLFGSCGYLIVG